MAAGKAYLAAAGAYNSANRKLSKRYPSGAWASLAQARRYWRASAVIERTFSDAIRKIAFPPEMAGDVRSLLARSAAEQAAQIEASGARTWTALASAQNAAGRADRSSAAAANLVRQDLNLPSVPY